MDVLPLLRPGTRVYHGSREATVLALDAAPTAHVWIVYLDDPDEERLRAPPRSRHACSVCEKAPGTIEAIDCDVPSLVCQRCFDHYADGDG